MLIIFLAVAESKSTNRIQPHPTSDFLGKVGLNLFFCWLGHFKVSFYYPHPINRAGDSILTLGQVASLGIWLEILCDFDLCTTG